MNYTIATGSDPDVKLASTNCHNSHVLLRNYELDTTGQADRDELEQVRSDIEMYMSLIAFTKNLINSQAMVTTDSRGFATLLSPKPSPPPPPPPVSELADYAPMHPPAPPELVGGSALVTRYEEALVESEAREGELVLKLDECFVKDRADDTVCGFSSNEAPNPSNPFLVLHTPPPCTLYVLGGNGLRQLSILLWHRRSFWRGTTSNQTISQCIFLRRPLTHGWRSKASSAAATTLSRRVRRTTVAIVRHLQFKPTRHFSCTWCGTPTTCCVAQGNRTSTHWRPTARCEKSCSKWDPTASTPTTRWPTALPTQRAPRGVE